MAKINRTRNTTKIVELLADLGLSEPEFNKIAKEVGIRMIEGQRNLDQNEVGRIRRFLKEKQRKAELQSQTIDLPSIIKVQELAKALEVGIGDVLGALLKNGVMATLNDDIDYDTAAIIADELGYKTDESVEKLEEDVLTPEKLDEILNKENKDEQTGRPPVVTIMGHVDHGKTTLLDTIRKSNVAGGEAGGITQAISSYQVERKDRLITFIDTPGHETFEFMRQRGASLADIAILVVAADDGVKPQTTEAVKHVKAAGVPIIVAINKVDKETANVEKVKKELAEQLELLPEEWGGKTVMAEVSALKGTGIDELLELVLLQSDVEPPMAITDRPALASVVESKLDKNLGPTASVLIHTGTLKTGDDVVIGKATGRARKLMDWKGKTVSEAGPSMPVTIVGLKEVPEAGEILQVVSELASAREKAGRGRAPAKSLTSGEEGDKRQSLALVLKGDSHGSVEALRETISAMVPDEVRLSIIRSEVGAVSDSDVLTAAAAGGLIYAFNTTVGGMAKKLAEKENVPVKAHKVIYELTRDVEKEIEKRMPVETVRTDLGNLKVLKVFFSTQKKKIVGAEVASGKVETGAKAIVWRGNKNEREEIGQGEILEMQKEKKEIKQAVAGDQIGFTFEGKGKIKEGDVIEAYREEQVKTELASS